LDAPLQHLRADDARWRLRVSVNGDSFLVDQATPLWLRGWRRGSNALLLELVDGRGEPLNPPFNSLVREVVVDGSAPRPAWRQGKLSEQDLARLLGQAPAEAATATQTGDPEPQPEPEAQAEGEVETEMAMEAGDAARPSAAATGAGATPQAGRGGERAASPPPAATASPAAPTPLASDLQTGAGTGSDEPGKPDSAQAAPAPASFPVGNGRAAALPGGEVPAAAPSRNLPEVAGAADPEAAAAAAAAPQDATAAGADPPAAASGGVPIALPTAAPGPAGPQAATGDPDPPAPVSGLPPGPSAREEVNPDGTLIRPAQGGPLQALRARLQR
ncbi:MAG: hypothetical protein VKN15_06105, partial [Cyanobacteriota bacterium]|nr:hypothetical protein [Cyanobacteriota bacterium]